MTAHCTHAPHNVDASLMHHVLAMDVFGVHPCQCQLSTTADETCREDNCHPDATKWQPRFDMCETAAAYELHGELVGMNKHDIEVEFTEARTLVVRGGTSKDHVGDGAVAEVASESNKRVETENGFDVVDEVVVDIPGIHGDQPALCGAPESSTDSDGPKVKFWLRERKTGKFGRCFRFPSPVDRDAVTASLENGILNIVVPKAEQPGPFRIPVH